MSWCPQCDRVREPGHVHPDPNAPSLFDRVDPGRYDLTEGERLRDEGISRVRQHTEDSYKQQFETVVRDFVRQGLSFTAEDVTARVGMPPGHPNGVGALTRALAVRYGCVKLGHRKATRTLRHAGEIAVWGRA